ncbi:MAG: DNA/RNA non-specific endonuclease [Eubacterium sp.]|nr:DNA/RNA non-specific endonuclease [Eubacterium sp.]
MSTSNGNKKSIILLIIGIVILICLITFFFANDNEVKRNITTTWNNTIIEKDTIESIEESAGESTDIETSVEQTVSQKTDINTIKAENYKVKVKYKSKKLKLKDIPKYKIVKAPFVRINHNKPTFKKKEIKKKSYQKFSKLDSLGRCGVAIASIGKDIMPTSKRTSISSVYPSGWHKYMYSNVAGRYLYNRCHLIGHQLTGQNANARNLITGTRYMNVDGMLPFEDEVANCVKYLNKHVMYRVRPIYKGKNLVASGVQMEAYSVEDKGKSCSFNVYCYNVQPGIKINYKTGTSKGSGKISGNSSSSKKKYEKKHYNNNVNRSKSGTYIISKNTRKFHYPSCGYVKRIKNGNRIKFKGKRSTLINQGYSPCKGCNP